MADYVTPVPVGMEATAANFNTRFNELSGAVEDFRDGVNGFNAFNAGTAQAATIASGIATVTKIRITLDTEGGAAADDLNRIEGGDNHIVILSSTNNGRVITIKHLGTNGNIFLRSAEDFVLDDTRKAIILYQTGSYWTDFGGGGSITTSGARVRRSGSNQSISDTTETALSFDDERWDTDGYWASSPNPTRLTAPFDGRFLICGGVSWAANATGTRRIRLRANGTDYIAGQNVEPDPGEVTYQGITTIYDLAAGEYVEVMVYQTSTGALNATTGDQTSGAIEVIPF